MPADSPIDADEARRNALECEWCGGDALPVSRNVTGFGYTYPRDEDGDVCCLTCKVLPRFHVLTGKA